jgi:hypothetical protein
MRHDGVWIRFPFHRQSLGPILPTRVPFFYPFFRPSTPLEVFSRQLIPKPVFFNPERDP